MLNFYEQTALDLAREQKLDDCVKYLEGAMNKVLQADGGGQASVFEGDGRSRASGGVDSVSNSSLHRPPTPLACAYRKE